MELAAELFPLQLSGCCAVLRPLQLLAHPPIGVDDAASISDISHCCLARGRPPPLPTLLYFLLFCAFFKFRLHSRLSCPRQEKSHHRWNEMKQGSGATSTEKQQKLFFSRFESGQRAEREKKNKKKKHGTSKRFCFVLFFSVEAPFFDCKVIPFRPLWHYLFFFLHFSSSPHPKTPQVSPLICIDNKKKKETNDSEES